MELGRRTATRPFFSVPDFLEIHPQPYQECDLPDRIPEGRARDAPVVPQNFRLQLPVFHLFLIHAALVKDAGDPRVHRLQHDAVVENQTADAILPQDV